MEKAPALFAAISGLVALAAGAAAWWLHHRRLGALSRKLRDAEDSRLDLAATAAALHRRLAAADQALLERDRQQRSHDLHQALAAAAPAQLAWQDTHPMTHPGTPFQPTRPAALEDTRS